MLTGKFAAQTLTADQETQLVRVNAAGELVTTVSSTSATVARQTSFTEIRANAILTSGFVAATAFPVPATATQVTLLVVYTRNAGSTTGYPAVKIQWNDGTITADEPTLSGVAITAPNPYIIGPTAATITVPLTFTIPNGMTNFVASIEELGDTTNLGNARLLAALGGMS